MKARRVSSRIPLAATLAIAASVALSGVTSAAVVTKDTGQHGDYYVTDFDTQPGGQCGYGPANSAGYAWLKWMWFHGPEVYARDTTPGQDRQTVKLKFSLQRRVAGSMTRWTTLATDKQTKTAWDDNRADFTSKTLYTPSNSTQVYRGVVNLKWMRNGSVEGQVTYRIEWYSVQWTVGNPDYVFNPWCDGRGD